MRITIPDALAEHYQTITRHAKLTLDTIVTRQLERFKRIDPNERAVVLHGEILNDLDQYFGLPVKDAADLIEKVKRLAEVRIGSVAVPFSVAQMEELRRRAEKREVPVKQLVQDTVDRMADQFFHVGA